MRQLGSISTAGFLVALAGFIMPWMSIVRDWPFALTGFNIALGKYNIQPTEYYALLVTALAIAGAILPNVLPKRKTWSRAVLALAGVLVLILMRYHLPGAEFAIPDMFQNPADEIEWRLGFYLTLTAFTAVVALNLAAILGFLGRPGRTRRGQRQPK